MAENSKIEWTDHTFNPWIGCTKVSDGCKNCYAEALMDTRFDRVEWGPQGMRVRTSAANWRKPLSWNRKAKEAGKRARVFCASLADVFEDKQDQPEMDEWRRDLFEMMLATPNLDWLLLTKRPENIIHMTSLHVFAQGLPSNVWVGASVENQETADKRIPELERIQAAVRFLSMEPLLRPVDLSRWLQRIDLVIVGGESGPNARPMHPDWVRSICGQCQAAGVPFFFKQWGEWKHLGQFKTGELMKVAESHPAYDWSATPGDISAKVGKHAAGRLLDGREWNQIPQQEPTP